MNPKPTWHLFGIPEEYIDFHELRRQEELRNLHLMEKGEMLQKLTPYPITLPEPSLLGVFDDLPFLMGILEKDHDIWTICEAHYMYLHIAPHELNVIDSWCPDRLSFWFKWIDNGWSMIDCPLSQKNIAF